jgi:hypothetical protein
MMNHWLLNTAAEFAVPLTSIFPEPGRGLNVKPIPRCDSDHYANGMLELFDSGQIAFASKVLGDDTQTRNGVVRILDRFHALSKNDPSLRGEHGILPTHRLSCLPGMNVWFKVTPHGGRVWEKVVQPDWARCVSISSDLTTGELMSPNRDLLFAYLGWFRELQREKILRETIDWKTYTDFKIVYWKRLPFVYHASFQVQPVERYWLAGEPQWFRDCRHSVQSWYTKPWDLPEWPVE